MQDFSIRQDVYEFRAYKDSRNDDKFIINADNGIEAHTVFSRAQIRAIGCQLIVLAETA